MGTVLENVLYFLISLIERILPAFNPNPELIINFDNGIAFFVNLLNGVGFVLPLNVFIICFSAMISIDLYFITAKFIKWIVEIIRG